METWTTIVQYAYVNCKRSMTEVISSMTNRERATNVVLVVFLFYHANVKGILVVFLLFGRKNRRYSEHMDNKRFQNTSNETVSASCTLYL